MSIKIKINKPEEKKPIQAQVELQVRKTLSGNYLITDHEKMDIVISPSAKSISAIPKMYSGDNSNIYSYQRDLDKDIEDRFTDPDESETTELGDVTPTEETPYGRASSFEAPYNFVGYGYLY